MLCGSLGAEEGWGANTVRVPGCWGGLGIQHCAGPWLLGRTGDPTQCRSMGVGEAGDQTLCESLGAEEG